MSDWSSDVCSSDLADVPCLPCFTPSPRVLAHDGGEHRHYRDLLRRVCFRGPSFRHPIAAVTGLTMRSSRNRIATPTTWQEKLAMRSVEHTSELQSLMRISYAVFCLKKKKTRICSTHTQLHNV